MCINNILDAIQAISVAIASIVAVIAVNSWKIETKWKKKYELAEEVLTCFYDISDRFDIIRNPAGYGNGETRVRGENESKDMSEILDNAFVVIERYERERAPFIKLKSLKYRFMALFGKDSIEPFNKIEKLQNKLLNTYIWLGHGYWRDQGRREFTEKQFEEHREGKIEQEKLIWGSFDQNDKFKQDVNQAISEIEEICSEAIERKKRPKSV